MKKNVSVDRLEEIASEIMNLLETGNIFDFLTDSVGNTDVVEKRLQEVMQSRSSFESIELAMYLRTSFSRKDKLPTWQPLLNSAIEQAKMRDERVDDIFYGLMPMTQVTNRNTGNPITQQR